MSTDRHISTVREFNRFYTHKIGVLKQGLLDSDCTLTEARVLYEIANRERTLAADLVRDLSLDAGYVSRILTKFARRGWLKREQCEQDARRSYLHLTAKGRSVAQLLDRRSREQIGGLLEPLSPEKRAALQSHLQSVQTLLGAQPTGELSIREHRAGDIGWIIQRHGAIYAQEYGWNSEFEALVAEICAKFLRDFDPSGEHCWIAERDGVPVGCIMLVRHSRTIAKLRLLLVEASERGKGVGHRLVSECLAFARSAGYRKVTLWTQSILTAARKLYESHGFKLVESKPHESFGTKLVGENWEFSFA
jgi:DNA-binding MarR family transcriptional regulator/N-acetylglutamate synthase-like GNAT family acetyltransferase